MKIFGLILILLFNAVTQAQTPILFSVLGNELQVQPPRLSYKLNETSNSDSLQIGNIIFDNESFTAYAEAGALNIKWDTRLIASGTLTMTNPEGKTLWSDKTLNQMPNVFSVFENNSIPQLKNKNIVRFCLNSNNNGGYASLCSQWYKLNRQNNIVTLKGLTKKGANARIIFQNRALPKQGSIELGYGTSANFLATLKSDVTYVFVTEAVEPKINDMIASDDGKSLSLLVDDQRIEISRTQPELYLAGKSGGQFTYPLLIKDPPTQSDRQFISDKTVLETYLAHDKFTFVDSKGSSKLIDFELPQKNKLNTVTLETPGKELTHKSNLEIYRGSPREAALRFTGLANAEPVFLGEGSFSWWFNDLFGWQHDRFSKLRWGSTFKYFSNLNNLPATNGSVSENVSLTSLEIDFRYRMTPGLWLKTPTWGLIAAYQNISIRGTASPNLGLGVFLTEPMPLMIDHYLNQFSYLNHPKWINIEFINYLTTLDNNIDLGSNYMLNAHGKMKFAEHYIAEAGLGLKKYYFTEKSSTNGASLVIMYATAGFGITF